MRRIFINEKDLTTNSLELLDSSANAVYIPGFAGKDATAEVGMPQTVSNTSDFIKYFGEAPVFAERQYYPHFDTTLKTDGFNEYAIPLGSEESGYDAVTWFSAGDTCPSYIYALSLLSKGLTICYERMNETTEFSFSYESKYIEGSPNELGLYDDESGNYVGTPKTISGVISDDKMVYYTELSKSTETSGLPYKRKQEALAILTAYTDAIDDYDVTVKLAYKYMIERAFNGKIETTYEYTESGEEVVTYGSAILNQGEYDIKYITTGGYPSLEYKTISGSVLTDLVIATAAAPNSTSDWGRGDCVALIDHTDNPNRPLEGKKSVYKTTLPNSSAATLFTPWCICDNGYSMPGSYVYLNTFADSLKNNPSWASVAGVARGVTSCVVSLNINKPQVLTNRLAEAYQYGYQSDEELQSINAITYVKNYGYCIWGNRTLERYAVNNTGFALSFLNTRNLVSEVKKKIYTASKGLLFEVNNDILWAKFKNAITPTLDEMVAGYGLKTYTVTKLQSNDKTKLKAQVTLYPTYCVESVYVDVVLQDDEDIIVTEE